MKVGKDALRVGLLMAAAILALVIAVGLWYWLSEQWHPMVIIICPLMLLLGYVVFKIATMPPDQRSELLTDIARKLAILAGLALSTTAAIFFAERGDTLGVFAVQALTAYAGWKAYESKQERLRVRKMLNESRSQPEPAE